MLTKSLICVIPKFYLEVKTLCLENLWNLKLQQLQDSTGSEHVMWSCPNSACFSLFLRSTNISIALFEKHPVSCPVLSLPTRDRLSCQTPESYEISSSCPKGTSGFGQLLWCHHTSQVGFLRKSFHKALWVQWRRIGFFLNLEVFWKGSRKQ